MASAFWVRIRRNDEEVRVEVEDNGPGIRADIADQLFHPFATTKPNGMGLGLLLSREIVRMHGGDLSVDKARTDGALFVFRLPAEDQPSVARFADDHAI